MEGTHILKTFVVMVLFIHVLSMGCLTDDNDDEDNAWTIVINGKEFIR